MKTLYQTIKAVFPYVTKAIIHYNKTGEFKGFLDDECEIADFYKENFDSFYDIRVRFFEKDKELDIMILESGQLIMDIGVPIEKIDSEKVLIDAVKEEIELILAHWESTLDEFEEI
jgi:hypothetical protein